MIKRRPRLTFTNLVSLMKRNMKYWNYSRHYNIRVFFILSSPPETELRKQEDETYGLPAKKNQNIY